MRFLDFLFPPREDERALRGVSSDDFLAKMNPVLVPATSLPTVALFSFADPVVRAALHEAKYHGSEPAFTLLALSLAEYLRDAEDARLGTLRIVPVPLSSARRRERGFNQAEEVVRRAASELGIAVEEELLVRTRDTASQVSLPRQKREENMRGAFGTAQSADSSFTYIVVDDVTTTGATLQAAIDALRSAGASHIIPLALAH